MLKELTWHTLTLQVKQNLEKGAAGEIRASSDQGVYNKTHLTKPRLRNGFFYDDVHHSDYTD